MPLYTIGHSIHSVEHLTQMLALHSVRSICDVRSSPYSQYAPQFNRERFERSLLASGFRYLYLGDRLGGRNSNPAHYSGGQVQYAAVAASDAFREALEQLKEEMVVNPTVLLCVEKDPANCHRALLVTRALRTDREEIFHILHDGTAETNAEFEKRLRRLWKLPVSDLLGDDESLVARAYDLQSKKIAYSPRMDTQSRKGTES